MSEGRECRLRPEYAKLYEEIPAGQWLPARELAEAIVRRASTARRLSIRRRTMDPRHFEFRGGSPARREPRVHTRWGDTNSNPE